VHVAPSVGSHEGMKSHRDVSDRAGCVGRKKKSKEAFALFGDRPGVAEGCVPGAGDKTPRKRDPRAEGANRKPGVFARGPLRV